MKKDDEILNCIEMEQISENNRKESKLLAIITSFFVATGILSGAIAVPILCRQFYYAQIEPLRIRQRIMLTEEQVQKTYNEIMDYCLGIVDSFELSYLTWSAEGASHFADVRKLFILDLWVVAVSILLLILLWGIAWHKHVCPAFIKGHGPGFWAATGLGTAFAITGGLAVLDFDRAFTVFHTLFFPGKDNWTFDAATDPVINMLPQVFFQNCALLVFVLVIGACGILILNDYRQRKYR